MRTSYALQSSAYTNLEKQGRILCSAEIRRMPLNWSGVLNYFFQKEGNGQAKRSLLLIRTCLDCGVVFTMAPNIHSSLKTLGWSWDGKHQSPAWTTQDLRTLWPGPLRITWAEWQEEAWSIGFCRTLPHSSSLTQTHVSRCSKFGA